MTAIHKALIIDDDEINNFICIRNIKETNFAKEASFCLKGEEGLTQLKEAIENDPKELPDVIFLDINMPMMNAWDFLKEYQTIQPDFGKKVHLFILSSSVYQKDIDKSGHYDVVTDYIIKPLNKDKLSQIHAKYFGKTI
ncbi:MAG: response regulator [Bacteroidetes bacterium]|nr:response regulator [Bacteroidota bacterium]MCB0844049.1 response regulator [Bacteroidota bacterium]